jgi:hypothetical protein
MLPALNLSGHRTSLSGPARARKPLLPRTATYPTRDHCWSPCSDASPIFNDIAEVILITAVFPHVAILGNAVLCVIVSQMAVASN